MAEGKVYLIGAGPGDPGLITVKGLKCLKEADVVLYDHLVHRRLVQDAREGAESIYVGKEAGKHTLPQNTINKLLIARAKTGKVVARLKGGDPLLFGRGGEEALAMAKSGVKFEFVPGVTAATAVPAYAGIPVTHRDFTSTIAFVTGHESPSKGNSSIQWSKIATGIGTLIFFMGVKNLKSIAETLIQNGRDENTPTAVIQWGTLPGQRVVTGNLSNIVQRAERENMKPPALIVVGEVVKLRRKLNWFESKPLFGKKIVVTRSRAQASKLVELLEENGAETIEIPTIAIKNPEDYDPLDKAVREIGTFSWIIFTSANGVTAFFTRYFLLKKDIRDLYGVKLAAIGPATKNEIESFHLCVDFQPTEYVAECFTKEFLQQHDVREKNVLLVCSDKARDYIETELTRHGAQFTAVVGYRTVSSEREVDDITTLFQTKKVDLVTFTSSSTVKNFFSLYKGEKNFEIASIGPITSKTATEMGFAPDIESDEHTIPGLVSAITNYYKG